MANGNDKLVKQLNLLLEIELSGVARYLHYSLMIFGPNRIPITKWFKEQASEALNHGSIIGEKITALGGHPSINVRQVPESDKHDIKSILEESLEFEEEAIKEYHKLLKMAGTNITIEEMARKFIVQESEHIEEVEKMLKGMGR